MKITIHIVTQGSNTHATITMIADSVNKIEYDATYRRCIIRQPKKPSVICDNGEAKEWNASCTPGVYTYYDVFTFYIE